jgi:uridine kinase
MNNLFQFKRPSPNIVALFGPSCSFKTTVATYLARDMNFLRFRLDRYYKGKGKVPLRQGLEDWEDPQGIDLWSAASSLQELKQGANSVMVATYNRKDHCPGPLETMERAANQDIAVDGLHAGHSPIVELADLTVYFMISDAAIYRRRKKRQGDAYTDAYHELIMLPWVRQMRTQWEEMADLSVIAEDDAEGTSRKLAETVMAHIAQKFR